MRLLIAPLLCAAFVACSNEQSTENPAEMPADQAAAVAEPSPDGPATIDCSRAAGQAEQAVCADRELAALDRLAGPANSTMKSDRDQCIRADELRPCLIETYALHIAERARAGSADNAIVVGPAAFRCGQEDIAATFINSAPGYAVMANGKRAVLERTAAGSGVRYEGRVGGESWSFWNKGREATLVRGGDEVACVEQPPATKP